MCAKVLEFSQSFVNWDVGIVNIGVAVGLECMHNGTVL